MRTVKENKQTMLEDYFSTEKTSFLSLLKSTKKTKVLLWSGEALMSIILTVILLILINYLYKSIGDEEFNDMLKEVSIVIVPALLGMLGFIISGLAIITGTVTNKVLSSINKELKANSIISIIFTFYFVGVLIGINILLYIILYMLTYTNLPFSYLIINIYGFIAIYLLVFSVVESIALLGSCIRLLLVCFKYSDEKQIKK